MPQIVKGMGLSNLMTGFVSSVPYIIGTIGLVAWGISSDRHRERRWHMITASILAAAGLPLRRGRQSGADGSALTSSANNPK